MTTKTCPKDWKPDQELLDWARKFCPLVDAKMSIEAMRDHTFATARRDWKAVARNWLRKDQERKAREKKIDAKFDKGSLETTPWEDLPPVRNTYEPPKKLDRFDKISARVIGAASVKTMKATGKGLSDEFQAHYRREASAIKDLWRLSPDEHTDAECEKELLQIARQIWTECR